MKNFMDNKTCIHVGCHKCGSTFLQVEVLPKLKNITAITFYEDDFLLDEMLYLCQCAELYYDQNIENKIRSSIEGFSRIFISSEAFSGTGYNVFTGGYLVKTIAKRLKRIFGTAKIFIVIREQKACIESYYRDDVKYGFLGDFEKWFEWRYENCQLNYFKYYPLVKCYADIFGISNVSVLLFEQLFETQMLIRKLCELNIDTEGIQNINFKRRFNESYSPLSFRMTFNINRFFGSKLSHGVTFGKDPRLYVYNLWRYNLSKRVDKVSYALGIKKIKFGFSGYEEQLHDMFHEGNRELSLLTGENLFKFGYV